VPLAPALRAFVTEGTVMRAHHAIAIAAAIVLAFGLKLFFFSVSSAESNAGGMRGVGMDIAQIHRNIEDLPVEKIHDMTFVFDEGD
jgi:hypothetical protein